jgi:hypothetical protein
MSERVTRRQLMAAAGVGAAGLYAAWPQRVTGRETPMLRYYYRVPRAAPRTIVSDVCVYGGTSAGIAAAVIARRLGRSVSVAAFGRHVGGMSASGLGATDTGRIDAIGGLSREFYRRLGERYGKPESFAFEPHVAEQVFETWVAEHGIDVHREQRLDTVRMSQDRIVELRMESGLRFRAAMFIDATYEGDLLCRAGVSWFAGREGNAAYGETLNGVQFRSGHQFRVPVDPYVKPGVPSSGLLAGIAPDLTGTTGEGDHRIQAFNFRVCLTRAADRLPFPKPEGYDPARYELLLRYIQAGVWDVLGNNQPMPNGKTDWNNNGAVSSDNIGRNHDWPDTDYWDRERIFQDHVSYQQGLLWFLANDPRVPPAIRAEIGAWGLPRDEFVETGGWPHELYVREARRMVSGYVMTEHDCRGTTSVEDSVGLASYGMDSHNCKRVVIDGKARNEGDVQVPVPAPFPVAYRSIVPRSGECENLLVPVCLSSSHIAYGSIRMEPVFMALGQAAATAASLAIQDGVAVQDVGYAALRRQLLRDRAVLEWPPPPPGLTVQAPELRPGSPATVVVTLVNDDVEAYEDVELSLTGAWTVTPVSPAPDRLEPGDVAEATWTVTAPAQSEPAAAGELRAPARDTGAGAPAELEVVEPVYVVEPVGPPLRTFASAEAHFGARGDRLAVIAGGADLWTGVDEYGSLFLDGAAGPGTVAITRLVSQDPTDPNARAGLAMRNDLSGAGRAAGYVLLVAKPQNGFLLLWDADGSGTVESVARSGPAATPLPAWLRLARNGSSFTGAWSLDGVVWTTVGSATVPSAAAVQDVGVVVCSHAAALGRAVFDGLEVRTSAG